VVLFKEIVTKAVLGKAKKNFNNVYTITPEAEPTTVLGCWIINHKFKGHEMGDKIIIDGSFDVNMWYSHDSDSKTSVVTKRIDYNETVSVKTRSENDFSNDIEIIVRALKQPNCNRVEIKNGGIEFEIEKELGVEVVGDAKVKISVEAEEEPWEIAEEEEEVITPQIEKEIEETVNENFLQ
jgi:spore coat protein E